MIKYFTYFGIFFLIFCKITILNLSFAEEKTLRLTCYSNFINEKPSHNKIPIYFANINFAKKTFQWSDISNSAKREVKFTEEQIHLFAESGVFLKKTVLMNRINGSFLYLKPEIDRYGKMFSHTQYEGKCEIGIKKRKF